MTTYPKISVVTPSYNQAAFLEQTILSVIGQQYPNLEYIVIDGGSTDGSTDIIEKYAHQISYWISEPDEGMYDGLQKGFAQSTGEIMCWINSDDILATKSLFTAAQVFNDYPTIEWLNGVPNFIDEAGRIVDVGSLPKWNKYRYLQNDFKYIQQEGIFWRRSLWYVAGGSINVSLKLAADLELWSRFFQYAQLYYITGFLGSFRARISNQKSLELINEYNNEALKVTMSMPITTQEKAYIKTANSFQWKLATKSSFRFLFNLFNLDVIDKEIKNYPPVLYFDRVANKFIIKEI